MMVLTCYRTVAALRTENAELKADKGMLEHSLWEFNQALKAFRRDILSELAALSDRLSRLEDSRGIDSGGLYE